MKSTRRLADLLEKKRTLLEQLRDVCEKQLELVDEGDTPRLVKLLAAKQRIIPALQAVESEMDPFRGQDPDDRRWESASLRDRCRADLARADELWERIMVVEGICEAKLQRRKAEVAEKLAVAGRVTEAHMAYLGGNAVSVSQLDLKSE